MQRAFRDIIGELEPVEEQEEGLEELRDVEVEWRGDTSCDDNFKVVVRVRPLLQRELRGANMRAYQCTTHVDSETASVITLSENLQAALQGGLGNPADGFLYATYRFTFDHVYDQSSTQEEVYLNTAQHVVLQILQGYNAAIIAYGQTGTGKTFTMEGELEGPMRGIIPRTVEDIFTHIVNDPEPNSKYLVRASYLQIYNEVISDLLRPERSNLSIREDKRRGVFVEGLSEWVVRSPNEVYQLMMRGQSMRATGSTKLNEVSSRSHAVCIIIVEKCTPNNDTATAAGGGGEWSRPSTATSEGVSRSHSIRVGKLNLVDLAGSERVHVTGAVGKRLEESKKINASLSALGNVIGALTDRRRERSHIPYRDSKLTRILEDSLGGNCKTTMICTVAPSLEAFPESLSSLKFAHRAKKIKNEAHVNEDLDQRTLLRKYERELRKLRTELQRRNRELVDKRSLLEVEEQKKRAEADKLAALTALEKRSREFLREKEEKKQLELKISAMQSQLLVGGASLEDVPAFRAMLAREHQKIRSEYETRLRELESERQTVEEDRQQADRYKSLLLKQRDIMIALTARLNERDEQIMGLQEELEAVDKYQRQLEDALDQKTAELITLRKATIIEHQSHQSEAGVGAPVAGSDGTATPAGRGTAAPPMSGALASALGAWGDSSPPQATPPGDAFTPPGAGRGERPAGGKDFKNELWRLVGDGGAAAGGGALRSGSLVASLQEQLKRASERGDGAGDGDAGDGVIDATEVEALLALLDEKDEALRKMASDNLTLSQKLSAVSADHLGSKLGPTEVADAFKPSSSHLNIKGSSSMGAVQQEGIIRQLDQRVDSLTSACEAAQKERSALQQILESKVQRMVGDAIGDAQAAGEAVPQQLLLRLRTIEQVLQKVSDAIQLAPPILPSENEEEVDVD